MEMHKLKYQFVIKSSKLNKRFIGERHRKPDQTGKYFGFNPQKFTKIEWTQREKIPKMHIKNGLNLKWPIFDHFFTQFLEEDIRETKRKQSSKTVMKKLHS